MDPVVIVEGVLALINQLLPLLGASGSTSAIAAIVATLVKFEPLIVQVVQQAPLIYTGIKNLIAVLKSDPSTVPAQLADLDAFDARIDAAFEAAAADVDPDAPGASGA